MKKPLVQSLREWLEIVTKRLSVPAKERISVEIEAHYAESVKARLADGMSEIEAQAAALAELGDAKQARKNFRRRHLTEWEADLLKTSQTRVPSTFKLLVYYVFFGLVFVPITLMKRNRNEPFPLGEILAGCLILISPTLSYVFAWRRGTKRNLWLLVRLFSANGMLFVVGVIALSKLGQSGPVVPGKGIVDQIFDMGFYLFVLIFITRILRLWHKLKYVAEPWNQLSPADLTPPPSFIDFLRSR